MVKVINQEYFIENVHDYKSNNEWQFRGERPVVIDFYADWCGPCKMFAPVFKKVAEEYEDKVDFLKVNTDDENELAAAFGIQSIPSILFVPKDRQPEMFSGMLPEERLRSMINEKLVKAAE